MFLVDSFDEFLLDQRSKGNSRHTLDYYRRTFNHLANCLKVQDVKEITLHSCKLFTVYLSELHLSSVSVQSYVRGFRAYLSWLYDEHHISEDLAKVYKLPKAEKKVIKVLTDPELRRLVDCFDQSKPVDLRNLCICALMFDSGLRLHEVVSLRTVDVFLRDVRSYIVVHGKGNKERFVPIGKTTAGYLRKYIPGQDFFFVQPDGAPITDDTLKDLFRKLKKRAKIQRLHPHLLRHTFATRYLESGGDIYTLQSILGHSSLEMVKRYLHFATSRLADVYARHSPFDRMTGHHDFLSL